MNVPDDGLGFFLRTCNDGSTVVASNVPLENYAERVCDDLLRWASASPERTFLAERAEAGWRTISYRETCERVRTLGAGLLALRASSDAPVAILAENGIDHALVSLAAMYVGVPVAPLSVGYAAAAANPARLRDLVTTLTPATLFAGSPQIAARVLAVAPGLPLITDLRALRGDATVADAAFARVTGDRVAKILFTSGSTGTPKGVITTNRMLCANTAMLKMTWRESLREPPTIVDWLPWSHCFGGNHNFGMVLHNGGTLYVDEGRPVPGAFAATMRNLREIAPTAYLSVPRGIALLVEQLNADASFAKHFFSRLRQVCNAGASLPSSLRYELIRLARAYGPHPVRITSSWGTTETAPLATTSWGSVEPSPETIGNPAPGVEIKFAPTGGRFELRVRGPNVTPGYWRAPDATGAAFDADGFYRTGDAGALLDELDPSRGIVFGGRLAENFKLSSGTWVNVGAVRLALLECGAPLVDDVVLAGHDRHALAALIFINRVHACALAGLPASAHAEAARHPMVRDFIAAGLARHNAAAPASSTRIERALILPDSPDHAAGEVTDKGSVNQRRALALRAASVAALFAEPPRPDVLDLGRSTVEA